MDVSYLIHFNVSKNVIIFFVLKVTSAAFLYAKIAMIQIFRQNYFRTPETGKFDRCIVIHRIYHANKSYRI